MKIISLLLLAFLLFPVAASADDPKPVSCSGDIKACLKKVFENAAGFLYWILFLIAVIFILVAAFFYVTGGGNEESLKKAKGYLVWGAIGMAVALVARIIPAIIADIIQ